MRKAAGNGKINIGKFSSLRKLMRAAKRGRIPDERMVIIETAERKAVERTEIYMHSMARGMKKLRELIERHQQKIIEP